MHLSVQKYESVHTFQYFFQLKYTYFSQALQSESSMTILTLVICFWEKKID